MNDSEKKISNMSGSTACKSISKRIEFEWCIACLLLNGRKNNPNRKYLAGMMLERSGKN